MKNVSPNEIVEEARRQMLDGREIEDRDDAIKVVNFLAANVQADVAYDAVWLVTRLYPKLAILTREEVDQIVYFQTKKGAHTPSAVMVFVYDDSGAEIDRFTSTQREADNLKDQLPEGWRLETEPA